MNYGSFLERVINDGIREVKTVESYSEEQKKGAIDGFDACRGRDPLALTELLLAARQRSHEAMGQDDEDVKYYRMYETQVEWTCNVMSAMMRNEGRPPIITPTARGTVKAAEILESG